MTDILDALLSCDIKKLKSLLEDGQDVNCKIPGTEGCTPLHVVVGIENMKEKECILSYLLEKGADPNARSYDDLTPVHIAAIWNNCSELEKLLQSGGNPWLTDNENKNSFDMAADNNSYEAYQLLSQYLADDKLNFRQKCKFLSCHVKNDLQNLSPDDNSATVSKETKTSFTFHTTNENLPRKLSLTENESDFDLNMTNFLKRKSLAATRSKKHNLNTDSYLDHMCTKTILSENESTQDFTTNDESNSNNTFNEDNNTCISFSSDREFSSWTTYHNEQSENDSSETIVDSDTESGIVLVAKSISSCNQSQVGSRSSFICNLSGDWKLFQSINSACSSISTCSSHSESSIIVSEDLQKYSNSRLFQELQNLGDNPGPILDSTRNIYLRRLARLRTGCKVSCMLPEPKYSPEVYMFLESKLDMARIQNLEKIMAEEFDDTNSSKKWREGNQRTCFNYFLLDPRITQNLPQRATEIPFEKAFATFIDSLFYVGKGTRGRPYSHLFEAAKAMNNTGLNGDKITHILDIWNAGLGVVSLHCFNNSIPVEAYTREACIIEAVGLKNLTNIKHGDFYGISARWTKSKKCQVGVSLLNRALHIFFLEGERQIRPKDIRIK